MPVPSFVELAGSPEYSGSRDSLSATVRGTIDWDEIDLLYLVLFPPAVGDKPTLPYLLPGSSTLYAANVSFTPWLGEDDVPDCSGGSNAYEKALAEIQYATIPYEQGGGSSDQILTRRIASSGQMLTLPSVGLKFEGSAAPISDPDIQAGRIIPHTDLSIRLHRVTASYCTALRARVDDAIGCVNSGTFDGYAAETVMLLGGEFNQTVSADGSHTWECELKFAVRSVKDGTNKYGWNHFWDPSSKAWKRLLIDRPAPNEIYPKKNFGTLFS